MNAHRTRTIDIHLLSQTFLAALCILLGLCLLFISTPRAHAEGVILWSAGEEDGTMAEWEASAGGAVNTTGSGTVAVTSEIAHGGSYSVRTSINGPGGDGEAVHLSRWAEPLTYWDAYYSAWLYFPERYSGMNWWNIFQWESSLPSSDSIPLWIVNVGNRDDGSMYFYLFDWVNRSYRGQSVASVPVGRWVHLETYYKQATDSTGRITVWQDGSEILDVSGIATRRAGDQIRWSVNNATDNATPRNPTIFVDDAAISKARLGPEYLLAKAPTTTEPNGKGSSNFYVDSDAGSDDFSGTTPSDPWKSLDKVNSANLAPGDAVNFKRGGHWQGTLNIKSSGTSSAPIVIRAYGTGLSPQISNTRVKGTRAVVLNGSYIVFRDFNIHDAMEAGIEVKGNFNTVRDNEVRAAGWGVSLLGQNNRVINNYLHDLLMIVDDAESDNDFGAVGVAVWGGASNSEIAYNFFLRCRAPSHDYGTDGGVVEFWESSQSHDIHHNYSRENNSVFEVGGGALSNVTVHDNVSFDDYGGYVGFHWGGHFAATVSNFIIEGNSIIQWRRGDTLFSHYGGNPPDSGRVVVRNNTIITQQRVFNSTRFTHTGNSYYLANGGSLGPGISLGPGEKMIAPSVAGLPEEIEPEQAETRAPTDGSISLLFVAFCGTIAYGVKRARS